MQTKIKSVRRNHEIQEESIQITRRKEKKQWKKRERELKIEISKQVEKSKLLQNELVEIKDLHNDFCHMKSKMLTKLAEDTEQKLQQKQMSLNKVRVDHIDLMNRCEALQIKLEQKDKELKRCYTDLENVNSNLVEQGEVVKLLKDKYAAFEDDKEQVVNSWKMKLYQAEEEVSWVYFSLVPYEDLIINNTNLLILYLG